MSIASVIKKENIIVELKATKRNDAILELANTLAENGFVKDGEAFCKAVLEREEAISTGLGNGIAIPHGKSDEVITSVVAFAKSKEGIEWEAIDAQPVKMVFLLAIENGENHGNEHLKVLAEVSTKLMDDDFVESLKNATTVEEICQIMNEEK